MRSTSAYFALFAASVALLIGVAATWTAPRAAEEIQLSDEIIQTFTVQNVTEALKSIGLTEVTTDKTESGTEFVSVVIEGTIFDFIPHACSKETGGCHGLFMLHVWPKEPKPIPLDTVNEFNAKYPYAKIYQYTSGDLGLAHDVIALGGITKANLVINMFGMFSMPNVFRTHLVGKAVSFRDTSPRLASAAQRQAHLAQVERIVGPIPDFDVKEQMNRLPKNALKFTPR